MFFNFLDELRVAGFPASLKVHPVLLEQPAPFAWRNS